MRILILLIASIVAANIMAQVKLDRGVDRQEDEGRKAPQLGAELSNSPMVFLHLLPTYGQNYGEVNQNLLSGWKIDVGYDPYLMARFSLPLYIVSTMEDLNEEWQGGAYLLPPIAGGVEAAFGKEKLDNFDESGKRNRITFGGVGYEVAHISGTQLDAKCFLAHQSQDVYATAEDLAALEEEHGFSLSHGQLYGTGFGGEAHLKVAIISNRLALELKGKVMTFKNRNDTAEGEYDRLTDCEYGGDISLLLLSKKVSDEIGDDRNIELKLKAGYHRRIHDISAGQRFVDKEYYRAGIVVLFNVKNRRSFFRKDGKF